jgi:hypothetical protein
MKSHYLLVLCSLLGISGSSYSEQQTIPAHKKKLTLLIYMNGQNNLEPYVHINKRWIEKEGVDPDMNVLLFVGTHRQGEPKSATKAVVIDHKTTIVEKIPEIDFTTKEAFLMACRWATTEYPANEMAIIMWGHEIPHCHHARCIAWDNSSTRDFTSQDLQEMLETTVQKYLHGKKLAFIGFDSATQSSMELASAIKPYAHFMIASENNIPAIGWPYHFIMKAFKEHKNNLTTFITHDIVDAYKNYYDRIAQDYTLACIDLNKIDPIIENINNISQTLSDLLNVQKSHSVSDALSDVSTDTTRFDEPAYADLYDWYTHILKKVNSFICIKKEDTTRLTLRLQLLATQGIDLIAKTVVTTIQGTDFPRAHGMLIYLPEQYIDKTYLITPWTNQTKWLRFLRAYLEQARFIEQSNLPE